MAPKRLQNSSPEASREESRSWDYYFSKFCFPCTRELSFQNLYYHGTGSALRQRAAEELQAEEEQEDSSDLRYVVWSCGLGFLLGVLLSALVVSSAISPFNVLSPGASLACCARSPRRFEMEGTASIGFRIA